MRHFVVKFGVVLSIAALALFREVSALRSRDSLNPSEEGTLPFAYQGDAFETYYKVFGDLSNRTRTPLVVVHGGPGISHDYLLPISDLASTTNIPIIFYDQIGNARSSHLKDKPTSFITIPLFLSELENLLAHFNISDSFDLLGHSWGGVLGAEFAVGKQPSGLRRFIASNSLPDFALWQQSFQELAQTMPKAVQTGLAVGMQDPTVFWDALQQFHGTYGCTVKPTPQEYLASMEYVFGPNGDPTVPNAHILRGWSIIDRLHLIQNPVLVINGRMDIAQDFVVEPFVDNIPNVNWVTFEKSAHVPFYEEHDDYIKLVANFLE